MERFVEIAIDGQIAKVKTTTSLLQALREQGKNLPALCYHRELEGGGHCGLCVVEVSKKGECKPQLACLMKPEQGLQVKTKTLRIDQLRSWCARLLLQYRPFVNPEVEKMLLQLIRDGDGDGELNYDYEGSRKTAKEKASGCILCGLCIRICRKIGKNRLTFLGRGKSLRVGFVPAKNEADNCGRCKACFLLCPTGFISTAVRQAFMSGLYK
ncbi:2Fe-2S iron-sulfur cluster-binding protein [Sporomusa acidovorans]|uniref:NADPH-Fe(3+) oxidoreductase subunit alpha n=1 Tax=Sporomusa acidovorans (strain ATCC 49682 / DSM 3132 / Mol) TaxID=1123286 RepID=A0ABZ3J1X4_SPOA4|nr:2Fe-2S iron-sulfur cluster-binding protein [Sporomusa acidovorans]OZC23169.1 NADPH-Fe(3+) oxidoreductase subunit alpha [Sporomusa acidovorans DSM 3132]SDE96571.1 2Fe-2S iron-sulfur cluster binding domain-containing protein [Sporomusa acidovorans]